MARGIDATKQVQWRLRFQRYEKSDVTVAEFCLGEGVSQASFYYWRKVLAKSAADQELPKRAAGFAAVRIVGSAGVTVLFASGARVEVPAGDVEALRLVIDTLARVDAERAEASAC